MTDNEEKSIRLSENRKELRQRVASAKGCLVERIKSQFAHSQFDYKAKRLITESGNYSLQWLLRLHPEKAISYENPQTSVGVVVLRRLK